MHTLIHGVTVGFKLSLETPSGRDFLLCYTDM